MDNLFELVMIVKNAEDVIEKTLRYAKSLVSRYTILDTGSTDRTVELIRATMAGVPGELHQEAFVDFATTRNRAFELASKQCKYYIVLDDTYLVTNADAIRKAVLARPQADAFAVLINTADETYYNIRITRVSSNLKYRYRVHEVIDIPNEKVQALPKDCILTDNTNIAHSRRTLARQERDYQHLLLDLAAYPEDPYVLFNLGRNRFNLKKYTEAQSYLQKVLINKDAGFHAYEAAILLSSIYRRIQQSQDRILNLLQLAAEIDSTRVDGLFHLAAEYYSRQDFTNALKWVKKAWKQLQKPDNVTGSVHVRNVEIPHLYIECLIQKQDFTKAQEILVQALKEHPTEVRFQNTAYAVTPRNPSQTFHKLDSKLCVIHTGGKAIWNPEQAEEQSMVEVMAVRFAEALVARGWKAMVFGPFAGEDVNYETMSRGVEYISDAKYGDMCMKYHIDVLVVCNSSNNLVFFDNIKQVYLWTHQLAPSSEGSIQVHREKFKGLITLSDYQKGVIQRVYPAPDSAFVKSRYGINLKHYSARRDKVSGRFLFSGMPQQGLAAAMKIVDGVREFMPEATMRVLCRSDLMDSDLLKEVSSRSYVEMVDVTTPVRRALECLTAEWLLLPTDQEDAFNIQAVEGMAGWCTVVASRVGCLAEVIGAGGTTVPLVKEEANVAGFVSTIKLLSEKPELRDRLVAAGRERALTMGFGGVVDDLLETFARNEN